jgi:hypothetical protein
MSYVARQICRVTELKNCQTVVNRCQKWGLKRPCFFVHFAPVQYFDGFFVVTSFMLVALVCWCAFSIYVHLWLFFLHLFIARRVSA